ncbi:MAG: TMEM175 family protein [Actinomycetota bacterium]
MSEGDERPAERREEEQASDVGRILAVSDGVFAIALTLLILEFAIPPGLSRAEFRHRLADLVPNGLAYALSFATIARLWTLHRVAFRRVVRTDGTLVALNFLFLGFIAFLPFPTLVLGRYGDELGGAVFYAACITATSISSTALVWYVTARSGLLRPGGDPEALRVGRVRFLTATIVFALSIPAAFLDVRVAEALWVVVFLLGPIVRRLAARRGVHEKGTSSRLAP